MATDELIRKLQYPQLYDHPIKYFKVIETHLSWVLLTGLYAYKIKKPVQFNFLDFGSLEKRKFFCEEELRLNNVLSGFLYLGLVAITGSHENPQLNGSGPVIEYAVKMEEFSQEQLLSALAQDNALSFPLISKLAHRIADFHLNTDTVSPKASYGDLESIQHTLLENFQDCLQKTRNKVLRNTLENLKDFSLQQFELLKTSFQTRKDNGFIKDCHGDLHLGNIVLLHHLPVVFDRIEFSPEFRCIDVINEIAFLTMDLKYRKSPLLANMFLNQYLSTTGDYAGLQLLKFYEIYRALVRAKVALLSPDKTSKHRFNQYLLLAKNIMKKCLNASPRLMITYGFSGSGKTLVTEHLTLELDSIHIRSDIERKRIFSKLQVSELYTAETDRKTYQQLLTLASDILLAGYSVCVDATFLQHSDRQLFMNLAKKLNLSFFILEFTAQKETLEGRITERLSLGKDASDATVEVLEQQMNRYDPLSESEMAYRLKVNTEKKISIKNLVKKLRA